MTRQNSTHPAPKLSLRPPVNGLVSRPATGPVTRPATGLVAVVALVLFALTGSARPAVAEPSPVGRTFVPIGQSQGDPDRRPAPQVDRHGRPVIVNNGQIIVVPSPSPAPSHGHPRVFAPIAVPPGTVAAGLPLACIERVALHRTAITLMEVDCLAEAGIDVRTLPYRCDVTVQTRGTFLRGFDPTCLGAAGYRLAGR